MLIFSSRSANSSGLTDKAHIVLCNWDSYRLKESLKKTPPAKRDKE